MQERKTWEDRVISFCNNEREAVAKGKWNWRYFSADEKELLTTICLAGATADSQSWLPHS